MTVARGPAGVAAPARALLRLGIRVRGEVAEVALDALAPVLGGGAEEVDLPGGDVEFAVYGSPDDLPDEGLVRELAGSAVVGVVLDPVPDGWETAYHAWVPRVVVPGLPFAIRPPWVAGAPDDLVIDPGAAFGAATHPSTRLALRLLVGGSGALTDWGTGTGILAIAGARLGHRPVTAVDLDGDELVAANAARAGVDVAFAVADLTSPRSEEPAGTVVANLPIDVQLAAARVRERPARLLLSGVLAERLDDLAAAWAPLREVRRLTEDGWGALELVTP